MVRVGDGEQYAPSIAAERRTIRDILGMSRRLEVPTYQRSFAWTKSEMDELWEDLQGVLAGDEQSYFLGPMVFVRRDGRTLEVVDGQQRLAALSVLFAVIRDGYRQGQYSRKVETIESAALIQQRDLRTEEAAPILTLNETDNRLFQQIVQGGKSQSDFESLARDREGPDSVRLLAQAYINYYERISERTQQFTDVDTLNDYAEALLNKIAVIEIVTTHEEAAYTLFETLNDRGIDLSLSDLLKNYLFSKAKMRLGEVHRQWTEIMATVGQGRMTQFIRHDWMSRNGKVRQPVLYRKLKDHIKTVDDVIDYVTRLRKAADVYVALGNPGSSVWRSYGPTSRELLRQVGVFGVVQCYPLLLSAKEARSRKGFEDVLHWIVVLTMRYNIIGGKGTGNLESAYAKASPICLNKSCRATDIKKVLLEIYPDDEEFRSTFTTKRVADQPIARLILGELVMNVN